MDAVDIARIQVNQLVGFVPRLPARIQQRFVIRVVELPNHDGAPRHVAGRAKGLIIAASGVDQSLVGKSTWVFLEDTECLLSDDWDTWLRLEIPSEAEFFSELGLRH